MLELLPFVRTDWRGIPVGAPTVVNGIVLFEEDAEYEFRLNPTEAWRALVAAVEARREEEDKRWLATLTEAKREGVLATRAAFGAWSRRRGPTCRRQWCRVCDTEMSGPGYGMYGLCSNACVAEHRRRQSREWARANRRRKEPTTRICDLCGEPFTAKRSDAKYCSPKCRQRAVRAR